MHSHIYVIMKIRFPGSMGERGLQTTFRLWIVDFLLAQLSKWIHSWSISRECRERERDCCCLLILLSKLFIQNAWKLEGIEWTSSWSVRSWYDCVVYRYCYPWHLHQEMNLWFLLPRTAVTNHLHVPLERWMAETTNHNRCFSWNITNDCTLHCHIC